MCGRFSIIEGADEIKARFRAAHFLDADDYAPHYNAAPGQELPFVAGDPRTAQLAHWGMRSPWAKAGERAKELINARSETVFQKPTFAESARMRRCLIPANSFFEWTRAGRTRVPYRFLRKDEAPFAFAGVYTPWGANQKAFVILTTTANQTVAKVHGRMPVMLLPEKEDVWLDPSATIHNLQLLLEPYPDRLLRAYPVSVSVNHATNDTPEVLEPASGTLTIRKKR
jgi:putative SOS response-associated peptidase YedK